MIPARAVRKYSLAVFCGFLIAGNLGAQKLLDSIVTYYYPSGGDSINGVRITSAPGTREDMNTVMMSGVTRYRRADSGGGATPSDGYRASERTMVMTNMEIKSPACPAAGMPRKKVKDPSLFRPSFSP